MSSFSQLSVSSQNSRGTKKKWFLEKDVTLVACMVDLYNVGIYNVNTGFKAVEKTIAALVGTSIGRWLLLKMLCETYI
ncbi:hypothetical protein Gohar_013887 [Gossypium harknessii]|uniref:Uncharacterized protein n=1 Tax=Gossypium harknessii TaxID=34285 RepID=A0A7J9H1Q1_9ROSI|nr:hypothetical protein [Gossypium harknessii]